MDGEGEEGILVEATVNVQLMMKWCTTDERQPDHRQVEMEETHYFMIA